MHKMYCQLFALPILTLLMASPLEAQQPPAEYVAAEREFAMARPELFRLNDLIEQEMSRVLTNTPEPAQMAQLLPDKRTHVSLSDLNVPLHLRLIERRRETYMAVVAWARNTGHCDDPELTPVKLADPAIRKSLRVIISCRQEELDRWQTAIHQINKASEVSLLELKVPPDIQVKMQAEARKHTMDEDATLVPIFQARRAIWNAMADILQFAEAHATELQIQNNQLLFANDADAKEAQQLMNKLQSAIAATQ
jgi:hypothetical protein